MTLDRLNSSFIWRLQLEFNNIIQRSSSEHRDCRHIIRISRISLRYEQVQETCLLLDLEYVSLMSMETVIQGLDRAYSFSGLFELVRVNF